MVDSILALLQVKLLSFGCSELFVYLCTLHSQKQAMRDQDSKPEELGELQPSLVSRGCQNGCCNNYYEKL